MGDQDLSVHKANEPHHHVTYSKAPSRASRVTFSITRHMTRDAVPERGEFCSARGQLPIDCSRLSRIDGIDAWLRTVATPAATRRQSKPLSRRKLAAVSLRLRQTHRPRQSFGRPTGRKDHLAISNFAAMILIHPKPSNLNADLIRTQRCVTALGATAQPQGIPWEINYLSGIGWGTWIRTREWRNQNPLPYHLAMPHPAAVRPAPDRLT